MAKKKSFLKGLVKFIDDLSPSSKNANTPKGLMRSRNSKKRKKKKSSWL